MRHNRFYDVATNTWRLAPDMQQRRWYSTATALRGGDKVMVTSGSRYFPAHTFGGALSGPAPDDSIRRLGIAEGGDWEPSAGKPEGLGPANWPQPREGHTGLQNDRYLKEIYVGGQLNDGQYTNEIWTLGRVDGPQTLDYVYDWFREVPPQPHPAARAEHTTVLLEDGSMVLFGGRGKTPLGQDAVFDDAWRLYRTPPPASTYQWRKLTTSGSQPSPRYSHGAVYDAARRRMLVFGGAGPNQSASDDTVWALNISVDMESATWCTLTVSGPRPAPRYNHTLVWDRASPQHEGQTSRRAVLFGGKGQFPSDTLSNELWFLWINDSSGAIEWEAVTPSGTPPSRRAQHSAWYWPGRIFVLGGETASGKTNTAHYVTLGATVAWNAYQAAPTVISNQSSVLHEGTPVISRTPEVLTLGSSAWAPRDSAYLWLEYYQQVFVAPGGKVFASGPGGDSWRLDPADPLGKWERYPTTGSGFHGGSAVMYRPGRVMKCGSRDTEGAKPAIGTTKAINLNDASPAWAASDTMLGRVNHNLVILPTGQVLVVGGTRINEDNSTAVKQPEIWDPTWNNWTGTWYGRSGTVTLQPDNLVRGYHSTALLLPSGQVLCAGGDGAADDQVRANIYCPPYLFNASGTPLPRPQIELAPKRLTYGSCFNILTPQASTIQSACLIRPGATTHGFDQNQRYIPLAITPATTGPARLLANAPTSMDDAPAGDYLLFIVDGAGGNTVPSVGQWVRLDPSSGCDSAPPDAAFDFGPDLVSQNSIYLSWTAPGDDGSSGTASLYDLRRSSQPITNEANFATATLVTGEPPPQTGGTPELFGITSLAPCTWYHFGLRTFDEVRNPAALHSLPISVKTLCGGGGGGGASARLVGDEREGGGTGRRDRAEATGASVERRAESTALVSTPSGMIVSTERVGDGGWRITLHAGPTGEPHAEDDHRVVIEESSGEDQWRTRASMVPDPSDGELGLCALRDRGRVVLPGGFGVTRIARAFGKGPSRLALTGAIHSSLGSLDPDQLAAARDAALADGDILSLTYEPGGNASAESEGAAEEAWYLVIGREAASGGALRTRAPRGGGVPPLAFALHKNQPNPFSSRTTIRFDLPVGVSVRLEVFDVRGRQLSVLTDRFYPAGSHAVEWDKRTLVGGSAGPGVYFYRIQAGRFRDQKKLVLVP